MDSFTGEGTVLDLMLGNEAMQFSEVLQGERFGDSDYNTKFQSSNGHILSKNKDPEMKKKKYKVFQC